MASSAVLLVCALAVAGGSRFDDWMITTPKSPYSQGTSAAGYSSPLPCWCGPHSDCFQPLNGTKQCTCRPGYIGVPPSCRPGPELWDLCYEDSPCGPHSECEAVNGTSHCPYCVPPYEGTPPSCRPPPACTDVKAVCGPHAECNPTYEPPCTCLRGFVGTPPNCTAGPALLALCDPYPCGAHADCRTQDGRHECACSRGCVGEPPHCTPGPELWRACFRYAPCGAHAKCELVDRVAVCSACDEGFVGEPPYCLQAKVNGTA